MDMSQKATPEELARFTEAELRDAKEPWPHTPDELQTIIAALVDRQHDYGTCVYAMSIAATAAFNYVAHKLGVTGFQASCADLDIIRRTRHLEQGFQIIDYANLLYPQYREEFADLSFDSLLRKNATELKKHARVLLDEGNKAHSSVREHWEMILTLPDSD
jgi:hypothetical protein